MFPTGVGIMGPLHGDITQTANKPASNKKINDTLRGGFNWYQGSPFGRARFAEHGLDEPADLNGDSGACCGCGTVNGPVVDANFGAAVDAAVSKANAVTIRVTLGDNAGAYPQLAPNGGTVFQNVLTLAGSGGGGNCHGNMTNIDQPGGAIIDTRVPGGLGPSPSDFEGLPFDGTAYLQPPSTMSPLYFAAGTGSGSAAGGLYIDNVIIGDNSCVIPVELSEFELE
jgi:hypothetical protein